MPKNSVDVDVTLTPSVGNVEQLERQLKRAMEQAAMPLVDTLRNLKVGLDDRSLRKVQRDAEILGNSLQQSIAAGIEKLTEGGTALPARSARSLQALSKQDAGVAQIVKILGGYTEAAEILSGPNGTRRLNDIGKAFGQINDAAFQLSRIPAVDAKTNKLLAKLYKAPEGFRKMALAQQQQVKEALSLVDMQDRALSQLRGALSRAGMGEAGAEMNRLMRERRANTRKLMTATDPGRIEAQVEAERKANEVALRRQQRMDRNAARSRAVSEEKDRVLKRVGGIRGLRDDGDIRLVKAGLNRDLNYAMQQAAVARAGKGATKSAGYQAATAEIGKITAMRRELDDMLAGMAKAVRAQNIQRKLNEQADLEAWREENRRRRVERMLKEKADLEEWREEGRRLLARRKAGEKADIDEWRERGRVMKRQQRLNEQADLEEWREENRRRRVEQGLNEKADLEQWREEGRRLLARRKAGEKADIEEWRERGRVMKRQQRLNEQADLEEWREENRRLQNRKKLNEKADLEQWREEGRRLLARRKAGEKADMEEWRERGRVLKQRQKLEQAADLNEYAQRNAGAKRGASYAEAQRLIAAAGGIGKLADKLDIAAVRTGLSSRQRDLTQQVAVAEANKRDTSRLLAELDAVKALRRDLEGRVTELKDRDKPVATAAATSTRNTPRNLQQARMILREAGGDFSNLDRRQIDVVRPYLQDRLRQRNEYAEGVARRQGAASPEFARAAASAREYAAALEQLNGRAAALRPTIGDLGQVVRSFFRYALGYGALYQMLGAVTALGRGLLDLDEQFYNIKAITLSTDEQMRTIEGSIKQVGLTTKFTLNEIAGAAQVLAQAGTLPENIPQQLRAVSDFAAATNTSLADSADLLTSFKNVYKEISDGKAADMLTKALNLSKLQGADLKTIISYTAQTAEGYNISAEQLLGAVATLRNVGIRPSTIGTGLRQAMLEVFNPDAKLLKALSARYAQMGETMSEATISGLYNSFTYADNPLLAAVTELKRIGFGGEASSMFSRAFDVRAFNPLQALVNNFDQYNSLSAQVGVGQSATEASRIQLESLRATLENLGAAVVAFSDSVGGDMIRNLQSAASSVTDLIVKLTELDNKMKMESGTGLGSTIGQGLMGGVLGALLGGKGLMNRATGFAAGSYLGGSLEYSQQNPEGSITDSAVPAVLALATFAPALIDFFSAFRRRRGEISRASSQINEVKGQAGGAVDAALGGAGLVVSLFSAFGKIKVPAGAGAGGAMASAAGIGMLVARVIPILGWVFLAYQVLQALGGADTTALQSAAEVQRTKATAAGDRARTISAEYEKQQELIAEYAIGPDGRAKEATTAAQAVQMREQVAAFESAKQQILGDAAGQFSEVRELLMDYARKDRDARQADLQKINSILGTQLGDRDANALSAQMEALQSSSEAVRTALSQSLTRSVDELRNAIANQDAEGIVKAGAMQRVIDSMPEMRQFLFEEAEFTAEQVSEMYIEFNKRMAEEARKGVMSASERLEAVTRSGAEMIAAVALELGDSSAVDTAIQSIIASIKLVERDSVKALDMLAADIRKKAADLRAEAEQTTAQADSAEGSWLRRTGLAAPLPRFVERVERMINGEDAEPSAFSETLSGFTRTVAGAVGLDELGYSDSDIRDLRAKAAQQGAAADVMAGKEAAVAAEAAKQRELDTAARIAQRGADRAAEQQLTAMLEAGRLPPELMNNLQPEKRELIARLQDPAMRAQLAQEGAFKPTRERDGVYKPSPAVQDIQSIISQVQNWETSREEASKLKQREAAMSGFMSNPETMVEIARLQNAQRAAERSGDLQGAQGITQRIYDLQYAEQQKAVERARIAMEEAQGDEDKDATGATLTYNSELAKLESMRGDMVDKLDQYQKKITDLDLKRRTVETDLARRSVKKQFDEAVARGDVGDAQEASKRYIEVQKQLIELAEKELAAKGYSPEQVALEISAREELTTALIDQESAQRSLTQAVMQRVDYMMRDAGTGPTTNDKALDGYLQASGIGFTKEQQVDALRRDMGLYQSGLATLQSEYAAQREGLTGDGLRAVDREYTEKMEELRRNIGETAAELNNLTASFDQQALRMFDPTALLTRLQSSQTDISNLSATVQDQLVGAFDNLGDSMATAIINAEDLGDAIKGVIHQTANGIFTAMFKTGVNYLGQQGLQMLGGGPKQGQEQAEQGLLGSALGMPGGGESPSAGGFLGMLGSALGMGGSEGDRSGNRARVGQMVVHANTVTVSGSSLGGGTGVGSFLGTQPNQTMAKPAAGSGEEGGFFSSLMSGVGNLFGGIGDTLSSAWSGMKDMLGGVLGGGSRGDIGEGMKGGDWAKLVVSMVGSYFGGGGGGGGGAVTKTAGGGGGGMAKGFASGGMPSRAIQGKRSARRDNLVATATVDGRRMPINVEADEGILSRNAMALIGGEAGLNALNSGQMPMFSVGGMPSSSYNAGQPVTTGQEQLQQSLQQIPAAISSSEKEVNIANIYSEQGFADFVTSRSGRKVIINELKKAGAI